MKHARTLSALVAAGAALAATSLFAAPVTVESLLKEMVDVDANTYFPEPAFTARLWSSYDRGSKGENQPGWFANGDANQYLRAEEVDGHKEEVMVDAKGPGAITRFWITVSGTSGKGDIRIYIDGKLVAEANCIDLVSGGKVSLDGKQVCGAPLADSVSKMTGIGARGHDLYLPIPYAKSCKVSYLRKPGTDGSFYYNVETRQYPAGTQVESFSAAVAARAKKEIDKTNRRLDRRLAAIDKPVADCVTFDAELRPGQEITRTITAAPGGSAIRRLALTAAGDDRQQYLRSTVIEMTFDGEKTVWAPIGDFFGSGPVYEAFSGWFTSCPGTGLLESRWAMPFAKSCTFTIRNLGHRDVRIANTTADVGPYKWDNARSMHFGAAWHFYDNVASRTEDKHEPWDYDYAEIEGKGLFVGTSLSLWQEITDWWGEGDEKVFVDGEEFPSFIGTGTEDHYGYAWCVPEPFSHPFICQPVGISTGRMINNANFRRSVMNIRNRALDAIPFTTSIRYLMEMWHWQDVRIDFAPLACFYVRPGATWNRKEDEKGARTRVRFEASMYRNIAVPEGATVFTDFEEGYGDWKVEGEAFGPGPAHGTLADQNPVTGFNGQALVNTFYKGDDTLGKLTSPEFTIEKPFVSFLIGGGNYKGETCMNLVVDGKVERTAEGRNSERLDWRAWDVKDLKGKKARIEIVDSRKGHYGHINVDMIMFTEKPQK